jgi:xylulokinase
VDYRSLSREEFGTLGAALVAGRAVGLFPDIAATAKRFVAVREDVQQPDAARHEDYRPHADLYRELMENSAPLFRALAGLP